MKNFVEEYGLAIVTAVVIMTLLLIATPVGDYVRTFARELSNNILHTKVVDRGPATLTDCEAFLTQQELLITSRNTNNKYNYIIYYERDGVKQEYRVNNVVPDSYPNPLKNLPIDDGSKVYIEVYNQGNDAMKQSNAIIFNKTLQEKIDNE